MPTLPEAVAALKVFVKTLAKRKDVLIIRKELDRPAPKSYVESLRQANERGEWGKFSTPPELVELYALLGGAHIEWEFRGEGGGGCLRIPSWKVGAKFQADEDNYNDFGPGKLSNSFDIIRDEGAIWYVADGVEGIPQARLLFAEQGEGDAGTLAASSIAEYLTRGMAVGFAYYWPITTAETNDTIRRFQAPPVPPSKFSPGVRVHSRHFSEGCRGEVLKLHQAAPGSELANLGYGRDFALVRLDAGLKLWMATHILRVLPKKQPDYYEQVRADPWQLVRLGQAEGWHTALRHMGLLWGPIEYYPGLMAGVRTTSHSRVVAGLLGGLPLGGSRGAVALAAALAEGAATVRKTPPPVREMPDTERPLAFSPSAWKRQEWQLYWLEQWAHDNWQKPLQTLITGLVLLVVGAPADAIATVDPAHLNALHQALPFWPAERAVEVMRAALAGDVWPTEPHYAYPPTPDLPDQFPLAFGNGF